VFFLRVGVATEGGNDYLCGKLYIFILAKKSNTEPALLSAIGRARYINPHTDFGFKKLFGTEANKDLLRGFLTALLPNAGRITSLHYLNGEKLGRSAEDRKSVYDIYCETAAGEKFIVEMQRSVQKYFKDRSVFYSTFPFQEQGKQGEWDFKLNAVYTVAVLDFVFNDKPDPAEDKKLQKKYPFLHHVQLSDTETKKVFYDKLTFVYLELPKFNKSEEQLATLVDKWMYALKNLAVLNERPAALRERVFQKLFRIAEIEQMAPTERLAYHESQKNYWDTYSIIKTAKDEVAEKMGAAIEKQKAIIEGQKAIIKDNEAALANKDAALTRLAAELKALKQKR
jgi:predicted transposase/invertase (TIGR01784 family)